jgi:cyclopropane-fatty-acyl-phospholipid synthase
MIMHKNTLEQLFFKAGVRINGSQPWDIRVLNDRFYSRVLLEGSLGLGESYMEGWWKCEKLDEFTHKIFKAKLDEQVLSWRHLFHVLKGKLFNPQKLSKASLNAQKHYDIGNDLYEKMLDKRMVYTCAYWEGANTLEEAQEKKFDLICRKIELKEGMTVLDLGCGWAGFAKFAAEKYGARVVGVNVSKQQLALGRELCKGLPVELREQDYREVTGKFDRVVSIGIMEHVGPKNHGAYMEVVDRCLTPDGIAFIHTIGNNKVHADFDPWMNKYIFPNALIPSLSQLFSAIEGIFVTEDLHNIGPHYDQTLMAWNERFQHSWPLLKEKYSETFKRMWEYYLLGSAGAFRARALQLWQIVMTREGMSQPKCRVS